MLTDLKCKVWACRNHQKTRGYRHTHIHFPSPGLDYKTSLSSQLASSRRGNHFDESLHNPSIDRTPPFWEWALAKSLGPTSSSFRTRGPGSVICSWSDPQSPYLQTGTRLRLGYDRDLQTHPKIQLQTSHLFTPQITFSEQRTCFQLGSTGCHARQELHSAVKAQPAWLRYIVWQH